MYTLPKENLFPGGRGQGTGGEVAQTMCTHMNKCKNSKKKGNIFPKSKVDFPLGLHYTLKCSLFEKLNMLSG
jgi:hypothetical protein